MANTKKTLEEEFTNQPQATTVDDVNNQDSRTRLWQSLNTTYTNQMDESDKSYDKAITQQNNMMLSRGMGRSSYALQTVANLQNDKANARNKLGQAMIADYQNRIGEIEQQEKEDERWQQQFDYQKERDTVADTQWNQQFAYQKERDTVADTQWNQQFSYQKERDKIADQQWQKEYNEKLRQFNEEMAFQKERAKVSDAQWQKTYDENLRQFNAQMAQQEAQFKANYDFQVSEAAREQKNFEIQQAFAEKQWQAQQEQWKQEFNYNQKTTDQKLAYETVINIIGQGNNPSDDLLKRAGISRADANAMKAQATTASKATTNSPANSQPNWQKLGFKSEADYKNAGGKSASEYYKKIADQATGANAGFITTLRNALNKSNLKS